MSTELAALGDILSGSATEVGDNPVTEIEPTADEAADPAKAAPAAAEKPPEDKPPPGHVPVHALTEERRKRQELETRLAEFEAKKTPDPKVNLFEDPDGWEKALDARVETKLAAVRQESEQKFLSLVETAAKARHADFEEVALVFAETARSAPGLIEEARNSPDPAEFIYRAGLNLKRVQDAGSIEKLIEKAREEGRQEALAGKSVPKIPESLTEITGGKGESSKSWSGPKPLSALIPKY